IAESCSPLSGTPHTWPARGQSPRRSGPVVGGISTSCRYGAACSFEQWNTFVVQRYVARNTPESDPFRAVPETGFGAAEKPRHLTGVTAVDMRDRAICGACEVAQLAAGSQSIAAWL